MKCPSCGYQNLPGTDACEHCQTSLTQEDLPQPETAIERSLMEDPILSLQPVKPLTVNPSTSLADAIRLMRNHGIGCVLITNENGRLAGILTERDLLQKVAGQKLDLDRCLVEDFMSQAPESSKPEHPLGYALHRMIISDIRYLPVVDADDRPAGIVSSRDIIAYVATRFSATQAF
jgi:CBS domain-containing protein